MSPVTVVFVPGFWGGPAPFEGIRATLLKTYGYNTSIVARPSTGHAAPSNPTQEDDIKVIRAVLEVLVDRGHIIVLVVHSSGGFVGTNAVPGLTLSERKAANLPGGVAKIAAITAALVRPDSLDQVPPVFDVQGPRFFCKDPKEFLFNDLSDEAAKSWIETLQSEPEFFAWDCPPKYGPDLFNKVPATYLLCKNDKIHPVELQKTWADGARAIITECDAGHMVMLSQPKIVVDFIKKAIDSLTSD